MRRAVLATAALTAASCGPRAPSEAAPPTGCAIERCVAPVAVTEWTCLDGATAGPTGRCVSDADSASGCDWELRLCVGEPPPCVPGGCGLLDCVELGAPAPTECVPDDGTDCEHHGRCERQSDGACAWTVTPQVRECVKWRHPESSRPKPSDARERTLAPPDLRR